MRASLFISCRGGLFALLCAAFLLASCTAARRAPLPPVSEREAAAVWKAYDVYAAARATEDGPYRIGVSLRMGEKGGTRRATAVIWSNGDASRALSPGQAAVFGPVRLDVMAGFGTVVARVREAPGEFLAYSPRDNKAVTYSGRGRVRLNMGLPAPFGLRDVTALLRGRFHEVFGRIPGRAASADDGNVAYAIAYGERAGMLELRPDGLPARWREDGERGWTMEIEYASDDAGVPRPRTVRLADGEGRSAVLLVKHREKPERLFTADQLSLNLPAGVRLEPVRQGR